MEVLKNCSANIQLAIYGPIKDKAYWQQCELLIQQMPSNITIEYKGDVQPFEVQVTIAQYDAFVLLTKGENFGHALFEALSCGRPIITSHFTPWNNLQEKQAGWNVDIQQPSAIVTLMNQLAEQDSTQWNNYCNNAYAVAGDYYAQLNLLQSYSALFN
jgi:glycosyltransferase involved in cell wall biosynthesis